MLSSSTLLCQKLMSLGQQWSETRCCVTAGPLAAGLMDEPIEHPMLGYLLKSVQLQIEDIYKSAREQTFNFDQVRASRHGIPIACFAGTC